MKTLNQFKSLLLLGVFAISIMGFMAMKSEINGEWVVPAEYKTKKNTTNGKDDGSGKKLYALHCKSCHGSNGLNDGPKAKNMKAPMRKFNETAVQNQTDGELYYKSIIGRDEMPNYEKKIKDETDRWMLVNYIRTLK